MGHGDTTAPDASMQERAERWASTMRGHAADGVALAHADSWAGPGERIAVAREAREDAERTGLATLASKASGSGERAREEAPDPFRIHNFKPIK